MPARRAAPPDGVALRTQALVLCLALLQGCQSWPPALGGCRAALRPVAELGADRSFRTRARIERDAALAHLDVIVEKRGDELVLVARNELGVVLFALVQRGVRAELQRSLPRPLLPVAPRALLADVQQAFFSGTAPGSHAAITRCGHTTHFGPASPTPPAPEAP